MKGGGKQNRLGAAVLECGSHLEITGGPESIGGSLNLDLGRSQRRGEDLRRGRIEGVHVGGENFWLNTLNWSRGNSKLLRRGLIVLLGRSSNWNHEGLGKDWWLDEVLRCSVGSRGEELGEAKGAWASMMMGGN